MTLFENQEPEEEKVPEKKDFMLFDTMRLRMIFEQKMTVEDAEQGNKWFEKSLCAHLRYKPVEEVRIKAYTIRKG